jgi:hypothetical protein
MRAVDVCGDSTSTSVDGAASDSPTQRHLSEEPHRFEAALRAARGNITQAAAALGISKGYAMVLVKRFRLTEWAKKIRAEHGIAATGYPRGRPRPGRAHASD